MTINERIKALREDYDLTQAQLAERIHSNQRRISRIERKDTEITHEEIFEYCFYFKVSADYILGLPEGLPYPHR